MIKVIKAPTPKAIANYRVTCKHCGTIFECNDNDFRNEVVGHGDCDDIVRCPTCGSSCSFRLSPWFCEIVKLNDEETRKREQEREIEKLRQYIAELEGNPRARYASDREESIANGWIYG